MAKDTLTYEKAFEQLTKIVSDIEQENILLDELTVKIKKASELIQFCKERLRLTEAEYQKAIEGLKNS